MNAPASPRSPRHEDGADSRISEEEVLHCLDHDERTSAVTLLIPYFGFFFFFAIKSHLTMFIVNFFIYFRADVSNKLFS